MTLSNDQLFIRSLIIDRYENPKFKLNDCSDLKDYLFFNNKSESCIDNLTIYVKIENEIIKDVKFCGIGCAVSTATTDFLCEILLNKNINQASLIIENYHNMISLKKYDKEILGNLNYFENTGKQANRVKCALVGSVSFKNILERK